MITIGVLMGGAYADYSSRMIRELCIRADGHGNINLIFFPGIPGCGRDSGTPPGQAEHEENAHYIADALSAADVLIISDLKILQMLPEQPNGTRFFNVLEQIPYVLLQDDAERAFDQACALAQKSPAQPEQGERFAADEFDADEKRNSFEQALEFAVAAHKGQVRKGSAIPYIVHPIETALIAMTLTRDQDIIIAALFHDIIEDTPYSAKEIEAVFGSRVAHLVQAESENKRKGQDASRTWKIRKQEFIDSLAHQTKEEKIIALSDKLSNMRATHQGYLKNGEQFWQRFNEKRKEMHHWYYRTVADKLREFEDTDAWKELDRLIREVFGAEET